MTLSLVFRAARFPSCGRWARLALLVGFLTLTSGCMSLRPVAAIPANRVPAVLRATEQANKQDIDFVRLRQDPPAAYLLGPRDVLGIYVESVLGDPAVPPPVHFPESGNTPPAIGFPIPVREDGTIALPLVESIAVAGLSLTQTEEAIRKAYTVTHRILQPGKDRILVTLMKPRTYQVVVIRQETGNPAIGTRGVRQVVGANATKRGNGYVVDLQAYENDVLHALTETGGLPGLDAKNEVLILRGSFADAVARDRLLANAATTCDPCVLAPQLKLDDPNVVRIPLRFGGGDTPRFSQQDIILQNGDIVFIQGRETELFYTGGLLAGGEFPLPRDYDLDVLGALAQAGGSVGGSGGTRNAFGNSGGLAGLVPPTDVIILRNTPGGGQLPIKVDLHRALTDHRERILIQPGDVVLLKYKPQELIANVLLSSVQFNFLVNNLFQRRY